jgi:hypothetical protein
MSDPGDSEPQRPAHSDQSPTGEQDELFPYNRDMRLFTLLGQTTLQLGKQIPTEAWSGDQLSGQGQGRHTQSLTNAVVTAVRESQLKYRGVDPPFVLTAGGTFLIFFSRRQDASLMAEFEKRVALEREVSRIIQTRGLSDFFDVCVACVYEPTLGELVSDGNSTVGSEKHMLESAGR